MQKNERINGIIAAPFAPLDNDGSLNTDIIHTYYSRLEKNGVAGAFINGTTGEGASLTLSEKREITETWTNISKAGGKLRIINLVGGNSYRECAETAVHSSECGVYAIAVIAPNFFKPADLSHLVEYVVMVGKAVPAMPVYYYHIPSITGVDFPMISFLGMISGRLPNFAGIKFTKEDLMDFQTCLDYDNGKYEILWGRDECMLSALATGAAGFVGSTYNYAAPLYLRIIEAFRAKDLDEARIMQMKSVRMISLLGKYGGIAVGKAYMKYIGLDCGKFRLPVSNMTEESFLKFKDEVDKSDFKEFLSL
jgi:N-acetylneuraminate lyase